MKKSILCGAIALLSSGAIFAQSSVAIPTGSLEVDAKLVRQGTAPKVSWVINYPQAIEDIIKIKPDDTIVPKVDVEMKVKMIGVGLSNGIIWSPAQVIMAVNGQWTQVFWGLDSWINPNSVLLQKEVDKNERIEFASRFQDWALYSRPFSSWYYNGSHRIKVLTNGDVPPTLAAGYPQQTSVEDYLRPYLDGNNRLELGPRDVIYVAELTSNTFGAWGFDQQDAITLVNFTPMSEKNKGNNGRGLGLTLDFGLGNN